MVEQILEIDASPEVLRAGTGRITKVLIANRGEIALRIIRTARRLGIRTVAVFSTADRHGLHVTEADEAVLLGAAPARESYLSMDRILEAARVTGANAVHPGYGFLSENAEFAESCARAGIVFIGPPAAAIRTMGSKSAAKALMERSGIPLVPGYHGEDQDCGALAAAAEAIGFPVLIKASAGGGGKGMRVVSDPADLATLLAEAKREAAAAFGDDRVLLEKYLARPRHIEVQVFGDAAGNVVSLFERECTLQRRHQKVIEEAPSPSIDPAQRDALTAAACRAATAVGYVGAGTVEFIADDGGFYFIEMNTRLQVEHPVTEMITGIDLVEWQFRVAAGEALPLQQENIRFHGHAIEARVYAEDPGRGFLPSVGTITCWRLPDGEGVRVDAGFRRGDVVSHHYDPMLAKVVVHAEHRPRALERLEAALGDFGIAGITTNLDFLHTLVAHEAVRGNHIDTGFIERELEALTGVPQEAGAFEIAAAATSVLDAGWFSPSTTGPSSPWDLQTGWTTAAERRRRLEFQDAVGRSHVASVAYRRDGLSIDVGSTFAFEFERKSETEYDIFLDGRKQRATVVRSGPGLSVSTPKGRFRLAYVDLLRSAPEADTTARRLAALMPGVVTQLLAPVGVVLERNTPVLTIEAMKVVTRISTPVRGTIAAFRCAVGDFVPEGVDLADFVPEEP